MGSIDNESDTRTEAGRSLVSFDIMLQIPFNFAHGLTWRSARKSRLFVQLLFIAINISITVTMTVTITITYYDWDSMTITWQVEAVRAVSRAREEGDGLETVSICCGPRHCWKFSVQHYRSADESDRRRLAGLPKLSDGGSLLHYHFQHRAHLQHDGALVLGILVRQSELGGCIYCLGFCSWSVY